MTEDTEIEKLKNELSDLKDKLSAQRKAGKDVLIAQIRITPIMAKIKMAAATRTEKDLAIVRRLLLETRNELAPGEETFKSDAFEQIKECIDRANKAVEAHDLPEARKEYKVIGDLFQMLTKEQKSQIWEIAKKFFNSYKEQFGS